MILANLRQVDTSEKSKEGFCPIVNGAPRGVTLHVNRQGGSGIFWV